LQLLILTGAAFLRQFPYWCTNLELRSADFNLAP
jgi:hypothetical protein